MSAIAPEFSLKADDRPIIEESVRELMRRLPSSMSLPIVAISASVGGLRDCLLAPRLFGILRDWKTQRTQKRRKWKTNRPNALATASPPRLRDAADCGLQRLLPQCMDTQKNIHGSQKR